VADGASAELFSGVSDALQWSDGSIIIAHCGSNEVRIFDSKGAYSLSLGRRGNGPGDFAYLRRIFPGGGDSIAAFDGMPNFRLTLFTTKGKVGRVVSIPGRIDVLSRLRDGTFVGRVAGPPSPEPGVQRRPITLYRLDGYGTIMDSLRKEVGTEVEVSATRGPTRLLSLGRSGVTAVLPDRVVLGAQEGSFTEYSPTFAPLRIVTTVTKAEPVTPQMQREWRAGLPELIPSGGTRPPYADAFAPMAPSYRDLKASTDGQIWVQDPTRPGMYPLVWTSYKDGKAVARAELPPRFAPTQFGTNWVLGVAFDHDGIERVQIFDLIAAPLSGRKVTPHLGQPPDVVRCGPWVSK